ncbi:MAG: sulfatase [Nocardioides sp.]
MRRLPVWFNGAVGSLSILVLLLAVTAVVVSREDAGGQASRIASSPEATTASAAVKVPGRRPNIVLITADDLSFEEMRFLPKTRALLGDRGVTFTGFTAPHPLCCPSRAQLLTGQYAQNNGVRLNTARLGGYKRFHPRTALPVWLKKAGYRTGMVGKYLNEYPREAKTKREVGWNHWDPTLKRIYQYYGYTQHNNGNPIRPLSYHTDYVAEQTSQLIENFGARSKPYFVWSSFVAPHGSCSVAEEAAKCSAPPVPALRHRLSYLGLQPPSAETPAYNEDDVSDKPAAIRGLDKVDDDDIQELQMRRAQSLAALDDGVAEIVESIRSSDGFGRTLLVFTSDNGYLLGQHRYVGKVLAYEESVRVPLLMRGLGLPAGVTDKQTGAMIDLAPTFAALARAIPQVTIDGQPIVLREGRVARSSDSRTLLVQAGVQDLRKYPDGWKYRGVRTSRYTYVRWAQQNFVELYDRIRDPGQLANVARDPRYRAVRRELERRLLVLGECAGAECRQDFGRAPRPK